MYETKFENKYYLGQQVYTITSIKELNENIIKDKWIICEELYTIEGIKFEIRPYEYRKTYYNIFNCNSSINKRPEDLLFETKELAEVACVNKNKQMYLVDIQDIIVPEKFSQTIPSPKKVARKLLEYKLTSKFEQNIKINDNNILVDGYITYLLCKMLSIEKIKVHIHT